MITKYSTRAAAEAFALANAGVVSWGFGAMPWSVATGSDAPSASSRTITTEAFRDRFTAAELAAVVASTDPQIRIALLKLATKEQPTIDLDNAEVVATMARLVTLTLITPARSAAITA